MVFVQPSVFIQVEGLGMFIGNAPLLMAFNHSLVQPERCRTCRKPQYRMRIFSNLLFQDFCSAPAHFCVIFNYDCVHYNSSFAKAIVPLQIVMCTFNSSSKMTRSASLPASIFPFCVSPNSFAAFAEVIATRSEMLQFVTERTLRTAVSIVKMLPAKAPLSRRAPVSVTWTSCPAKS